MSFRQFGGLTYASKNNIVSSNYNTINQSLITQNIGQPNSYINVLSDLSGNTLTGTVQTTSDYRIKENVINLNDTFTVDSLIPVTYKNLRTKSQDIGLIAHELQEHYPELVNGEKDGKEMQSVNYIGLIPILIKEIQELKKDMAYIKKKIN
jgi:hypothetical protein